MGGYSLFFGQYMGKLKKPYQTRLKLLFSETFSIPFLHEIPSKSIGNNANKPVLGRRIKGVSLS